MIPVIPWYARAPRTVGGRDGVFPMVLVPMFLVPMSVLLHVIALGKLRQGERSTCTRAGLH